MNNVKIDLVESNVLGRTVDTLFITDVNISQFEKVIISFEVACTDVDSRTGYETICKNRVTIEGKDYENWGTDDSYIIGNC